jgi:methylmalonyl-CoA/ethylmalonyl-CoA epimerase
MTAGGNGSTLPILDHVHHLSFVVRHLDAAVSRFERLSGVSVKERGPVANRGAEVAIFKLANIKLELVAPAQSDSPLLEHVARHGEGFFHLAFAVADVDAACEQLKGRGVHMKSPPYCGYKDWRVAYLDSELTGGINMRIINSDAS